jgi:hypothetical protein
MNNLKSRDQYIVEMQIIRKEVQKEPEENFTQKEKRTLENCEGMNFDVIHRNKAVFQYGKYKISIYKRKVDDFFYRVRNTSNAFNKVMMEGIGKDLNTCLFDIDSYMFDLIKEDKARAKEAAEQAKLDKLNPPQVFGGKSFGGKFNY